MFYLNVFPLLGFLIKSPYPSPVEDNGGLNFKNSRGWKEFWWNSSVSENGYPKQGKYALFLKKPNFYFQLDNLLKH